MKSPKIPGYQLSYFSLAVLLIFCISVGSAQSPSRAAGSDFVPGRILVKFNSEVGAEQAHDALAGQQSRCAGEIPEIGVHIVELPTAAIETVYANAFRQRPDVEFAELDFVRQPAGVTPNDASWPFQWHMVTIRTPDAWSVTTGSTAVTIGIIDTGVAGGHPDLTGNMVSGWNFYNNNSDTSDAAYHGTYMAGTVAAVANNTIGVVGVCWSCKIMPLKVSNSASSAADSTVASAILWAKDRGVRIAVVGFPVTTSLTVTQAAQQFVAAGGLLTVPAGNDGLVLSTAQPNPSMITVSGSDLNDAIVSFSNTGPHIDLAAPAATYSTTPGNSYGETQGTSYSAAYAAGVAALVLSANANCSSAAIEATLKQSADDFGPAGWDSGFGWGRLNAARAVGMAGTCAGGDSTPPTVSITSPLNLATVSGTVTISANASDNVGVSRVEFYVDGVLKCTDTTGPNPYTCNWDTTTSSNASHTILAKALDAANNNGTHSIDVTVSNSSLPAAPNGLTATAVSSSQINLTWTDNSSNETGFKIERCSGAGCTNFAQIGTVGAGVVAFNSVGLTSSTLYRYQVRAYNTAGDSAYTNMAEATTQGTPPTAPSNLTATAVFSSQINLAWADNSSNETGFKIERCSGAGCTSFAQIATVGAGVVSYSSIGLTSSTLYRYQVRAYNTAGDSAYTNMAEATTQGALPAAPSNLTATAVSSSQINLVWTDNSSNEAGFKIERCIGAGCTNFAQIVTVGAGVVAYNNIGLTSSTLHRYRVSAYNTSGDSGYTNMAEATTQGTLPTAPGGLTASPMSSSQINLAWTDSSNNEAGFKIERCTGAACINFAQIATVGAGVTIYNNTGLGSSTLHRYRVRAYNTTGDSGYSNMAEATTQAGSTAPAAPSNLTGVAGGSGGSRFVDLLWADNSTNETSFRVERCAVSKSGACTFNEIGSTGANVAVLRDGGVSNRKTYRYRVKARNSSGDSAYSNMIEVII